MFDARSWIEYGGLFLVFLVVYGQTGLFFCFFVPSGAFMFATGAMIASGMLQESLFPAICLFTLAAILGNLTGYFFGRKVGPRLRKRSDTKFFKKAHLEAAEEFYEKRGGGAIIIALFVPIVRTFAPIVAGMLRMKVGRFTFFTVVGSVCWVTSFLLVGHLIGSRPFLRPYLRYIIIGIVILVSVPMVLKVLKSLKEKNLDHSS